MVVDLLKQLTAIPALNPEDTDDPELVGEARMADFLRIFLEERGFAVELLEVNPGRPNLIARLGEDAAVSSLMIEGHLDTVGIAGMTVDPFKAEEREGRIYGRGTTDPRGAIAAALSAFTPERVARIKASGKQVLFVGAIAEEKACQGAMELAKAGVGAVEALILEPTGLVPVIAHKGPLWFDIAVEGLSGHASDPSQGISAIAGMMEVMRRLNALHEEDSARMQDPFFGSPTLNVGKIEGGQAYNIIPDRCRVMVDRRNVPGEEADEILQRVRGLLENIKGEGLITGFDLDVRVSQPAFHTNPDSPLVRRMQDVRAAHGLPEQAAATSWFSDAGPLTKTCRHVMVFGPGHIAQAHTPDEYIEVDQLEQGARMIQDFLDAFIEETS